jgi:hypothetical protein
MLSLFIAAQAATVQPAPVPRDPAELQCVLEHSDGIRKLAAIEAFHRLGNGPASPFGKAGWETVSDNRSRCAEKFTWSEPLLQAVNGYVMAMLAAEHLSDEYKNKGVSFKAIDEVMTEYANGQQPGEEIQETITALAADLRAQGATLSTEESVALVKSYMELLDFKNYAASKFTSGEGLN